MASVTRVAALRWFGGSVRRRDILERELRILG